jgi:hypothetical protein
MNLYVIIGDDITHQQNNVIARNEAIHKKDKNCSNPKSALENNQKIPLGIKYW